MAKDSTGIWCVTLNHESQHLIVNGEAVCKTAKVERWARWQVLAVDEVDASKQCCRCKGWLAKNSNSNDDMREKFREWGRQGGRIGGSIGGAVRSRAKRMAARLRERKKRAQDPLLCVVG